MMDKALLYAILKNKSGAEVSASGNPATLSGTLEDKPLKECKIFGWSKQDSTTGAQLWDEDHASQGYINAQGAVGKANTNNNELYNDYISAVGVTAISYTYQATVPDNAIGGTNLWMGVGCYDADKNFLARVTAISEKKVGAQTMTGSLRLPEGTAYIRISWSKFSDGVLMVNAGDKALPYEPYTGGQPSPNPEYPKEIISAGMKWSTGKNLFSGFVFGGTNPKNENGITTTKEGALYIRSDYIPCEVGKHYVYNIPEGWKESQTVFCNSDKKYIGTASQPHSFTTPENAAYFVFQIAKKDTKPIYKADLEAVSKLVQVEQADACTEYEPYTGGVPKLYGDKIGLEVHGKNLFNITTESKCDKSGASSTKRIILPGEYIRGLTYTNICANYIYNVFISQERISFLSSGVGYGVGIGVIAEKGKKYAISGECKNGDTRAVFYNKSGELMGNTNDNPFVVPEDAEYTVLLLRKSVNTTDAVVFENIQVEEAISPTAYEPYHEPQSLSIQTPTGLPAIPVDTGGNYTDADGQQWIADYVDLKRGKYVQNIRIMELTGQEPYIVAGISYFSGSSANMYIIASDMQRDGAVMCNCLSEKPYVWSIKSAVGCTTNIQQIHLRLPKATIGVNDDAGLEEVETAYKNYIKGCYEEGNPIEIHYILADPIERDLTPSEIQAYQNLVTYAGTTIVENDADCYMEVSAGGGDALRAKKLALILGD